MTKISSAKQQRRAHPVEDEVACSPMSYVDDVLHVYGQPLKPHADYPWLWSLNSLLEAVLVFQRGNGVSEKHLASLKKTKKPGWWVHSQQQTPSKWKKTLRDAGRLQKQELSSVVSSYNTTPRLLEDYALQTVRGRHAGTYLCASLVVAYCRYLHPEFGTLVDDFFARGLRGAESVISEVRENRDRNNRSTEEILEEDDHELQRCRVISKERGANPQSMVGHATVGLLGEKLADFAERHGVKRPHRKNVIREMPSVGADISSAVRLGNRLVTNSNEDVQGDVKVGHVYNVAGALTRRLDKMDGVQALALLNALNSKA